MGEMIFANQEMPGGKKLLLRSGDKNRVELYNGQFTYTHKTHTHTLQKPIALPSRPLNFNNSIPQHVQFRFGFSCDDAL